MTERAEVGDLLRRWRSARGLSQMELAHRAGISPRHMSFVETGRSRPGREVLLSLADVLEVPFRERNALLEAAGYARIYRTSELGDDELGQVRKVLEFILSRHEPYSAVAVDTEWNVRMANRSHRALLGHLLADAPEKVRAEENLLVQTFHPRGLCRAIRNWPEVARTLLSRLERQAEANPLRASYRELLERLEELAPPLPEPELPEAGTLPILIPIELEVEGEAVRLFTTLTTLGTPQDALLQELRIESFFPADRESDERLRGLLESRDPEPRDD